MSARRGSIVAASGAAIAATYLLVAFLSFNGGLLPVRPLYEGSAPPPAYRWVTPPADLAKINQTPASATKVVKLGPKGSERDSLNTSDVQATLILAPGSFAAASGQTAVKVSLQPVDPATFGEPPEGSYDGNAYTIAATYVPSGEPAHLQAKPPCPPPTSAKDTTCATIVLRYAFNADKLWHRTDTGWEKVADASAASAALQIFADTAVLGTFVPTQALGFKGAPKKKGGSSSLLGFIVGIGALLLGTIAARIRSVKRTKGTKKASRTKLQKRAEQSRKRRR